jgi:hypothetical protein
LEAALQSLLVWWAHVREKVPKKGPNEKPLSALFAILDGFSPEKGPDGVWKAVKSGIQGTTSPRWEEYPPVRALYDFTSRDTDFNNWSSL